MLKAAANLTRDLNVPSSQDLLGRHARLGAARLCGAVRARCSLRPALAGCSSAGLVAVLALYRAGSFIHELTHIKKGAVKGFRFVWNLHRRRAAAGPELHVRGRPQPASRQALLRDGRRSRISAAGADASVDPAAVPHRRRAGADRHADPLRASSRRCRCCRRSCAAIVVGRYSGLQINPKFVRPTPEGEFARDWAWQEAACSIWAIALLAMVATGVIPLRDFLIFLGVAVGRDVPQPGPHAGRASVGE